VAAKAIWNRYGGVNGRLGYPTSEPMNLRSPGSWSQKFQGGTIQHYVGMPDMVMFNR
jgi:uncharacterized protein with LGFP repeats